MEIIKNFKLNEDLLFEMANLEKRDTGLPYDIWIDSAGKSRGNEHSDTPRIKIDVNGDLIPVEISDDPDIPSSVKKQGIPNIPHFSDIKKYVKAYKKVLLAHYLNQISDKQALNLLGPIKLAPQAEISLSQIIDQTPNTVIKYKWDNKELLYTVDVYKDDIKVDTLYALGEYNLFKTLGELKDKYQPTNIIEEK